MIRSSSVRSTGIMTPARRSSISMLPRLKQILIIPLSTSPETSGQPFLRSPDRIHSAKDPSYYRKLKLYAGHALHFSTSGFPLKPLRIITDMRKLLGRAISSSATSARTKYGSPGFILRMKKIPLSSQTAWRLWALRFRQQ